MNRLDLQQLAQLRVREAETLLSASKFDGAYYLAGYAVECALKACIARRTKRFDFPDRKLVDRAYTHNLSQLVGVAELQGALERRMEVDATFAVNWALVKDWSEEARYQLHDETKVRDFWRAVVDRRKGILAWLKAHW